MVVNGKCALCLSEAELVDSHFMPRFAYKAIKQSDDGHKQGVLVTESVSLAHDFQVKDHLLCESCERLFAEKERYVSTLIRRSDENFPILSVVRSGEHVSDFDYGSLFNCRDAAIDVEKLVYFAASIIWRGSVHLWTNFDGATFQPSPLGPFEESFRRYLLDEEEFPPHLAIWVHVRENDPGVALATPHRKKINDTRAYVFEVPGIKFVCLVGKKISAQDRALCVLRGEGNPIWIIDAAKAPVDESVLKTIKDSRVSKSLAKRLGKAV